MNISGIRPTAGFYSYSSIKTNALQEEQNLEDSNAKENEKKEPERDFLREQQSFTSYDYAKSYRPDVTYQLNESPVNVEQLDIDKMRSDLKKDQILQQYQYFVRGTDGLGKTQAKEQVAQRWTENFIL